MPDNGSRAVVAMVMVHIPTHSCVRALAFAQVEHYRLSRIDSQTRKFGVDIVWRQGRFGSLIGLKREFYSIDVQAGQRLASTAIAVQHCGHVFVAGAGAAAGFGKNRFTCLTIRKITNAMIRNSITVLMNTP